MITIIYHLYETIKYGKQRSNAKKIEFISMYRTKNKKLLRSPFSMDFDWCLLYKVESVHSVTLLSDRKSIVLYYFIGWTNYIVGLSWGSNAFKEDTTQKTTHHQPKLSINETTAQSVGAYCLFQFKQGQSCHNLMILIFIGDVMIHTQSRHYARVLNVCLIYVAQSNAIENRTPTLCNPCYDAIAHFHVLKGNFALQRMRHISCTFWNIANTFANKSFFFSCCYCQFKPIFIHCCCSY